MDFIGCSRRESDHPLIRVSKLGQNSVYVCMCMYKYINTYIYIYMYIHTLIFLYRDIYKEINYKHLFIFYFLKRESTKHKQGEEHRERYKQTLC